MSIKLVDLRAIYDVFDDELGEQCEKFDKRPFAMFYAKTDELVKEHVLEQFTNTGGTVRNLIATIAFGMGADCRELNTIMHFGPPAALEGYIQEVGRAGRDGSQSNAVMIVKPRALSSKNINQAMKNYVRNNEECRRKILLDEFDCKSQLSILKHDCCDICEKSCYCSHCTSTSSQASRNWWDTWEESKKFSKVIGKLNTQGKDELRKRLCVIQRELNYEEGQTPSE